MSRRGSIQFDLKECIGSGGFADVYRAAARGDGAWLAVKYLRDYTNAEARQRFKREVCLLLSLKHPHVVPILDYRLDVEQPYYVMPFMSRGCLTQWAGKLDHAQVRSLLRTLADVLHHLHERGALHRDFKPDNILVSDNGVVALGDFGLGNAPNCTVHFTRSAAGTPGYAAPELEQSLGQTSTQSDVFSLGATIFHLLTGVHPKVARKDAPSLDPWTLNSAVPEDLRNAVLHMVQADPRLRPSAATVLQWMGPAASASPAPTAPPKAREGRSGGSLWEAAAAVLAGLVVGGLVVAVAGGISKSLSKR
jgi:serine/threonine-protein kinase